MYIEPLNAAQIKHNFKILKDKYDLLNPDCPNCRIPVASPTPTQTPTITPTKSVTPTPTNTVTPTSTP
jgi:carbohydrate-binding DOMON domain-containing protein